MSFETRKIDPTLSRGEFGSKALEEAMRYAGLAYDETPTAPMRQAIVEHAATVDPDIFEECMARCLDGADVTLTLRGPKRVSTGIGLGTESYKRKELV